MSEGSVYTLAAAAQVVASALALPIATRLLGPVEFGRLATAIIVTQLTAVIAGVGLHGAITREMFVDGGPPRIDRARALIPPAVALATLVVVLIHFSGPAWSSVFDEQSYDRLLSTAVFASLPLIVVLMTQSVLRGEHRPKAFAALALLAAIVGNTAAIAAVAVLDGGAFEYVAGLAAGYSVAAIVGMAIVRPTLHGANRAMFRSALNVGVPTVPHSLALYVLAVGDRVVIERVEGLTEVGRYQVAYTIGALTLTGLAAFNNAWAPLMYEQSESHRWAALESTTSAVLRLVALGAVGLALIGPIALDLVASSEFAPTELAPIVALVAVSAIPYTLYLSSAHVLGIARHNWPLAWLTPVAAAINIALNIALVPSFGLVGAGVATLLSYTAWSVLVRRAARSRAGWVWTMSTIARPALLGATGVALGALLESEGAGLLLRIAMTAATLGLAVRSFRGALRVS